MKTLKITVIFLILVFCFSCNEEENFFREISLINCDKCTSEEPPDAYLEIKLEKLYKHSLSDPFINIIIYEGNLEDGIVYKTIRTTNNETAENVPLNKKYTITAEYSINTHSYIAVTSVTPHVKYDRYNCNDPCYYVVDNSVNLRLKYTK
jgi:hypothetical protein